MTNEYEKNWIYIAYPPANVPPGVDAVFTIASMAEIAENTNAIPTDAVQANHKPKFKNSGSEFIRCNTREREKKTNFVFYWK